MFSSYIGEKQVGIAADSLSMKLGVVLLKSSVSLLSSRLSEDCSKAHN